MDSAERAAVNRSPSARRSGDEQECASYRLDDQVGFLLRRVTQRHVSIFAEHMGEDITPMRWAVLAKLHETGPSSQNRLGRNTAMDAATIKGVVDRLMDRGLIETQPDPLDARRRVIGLTEAGRRLVERSLATALAITRMTLAPLTQPERAILLSLLRKLA
jgi:MarR family transcriptional regulator, lower aerobic nicotinate degradation pathway regulator